MEADSVVADKKGLTEGADDGNISDKIHSQLADLLRLEASTAELQEGRSQSLHEQGRDSDVWLAQRAKLEPWSEDAPAESTVYSARVTFCPPDGQLGAADESQTSSTDTGKVESARESPLLFQCQSQTSHLSATLEEYHKLKQQYADGSAFVEKHANLCKPQPAAVELNCDSKGESPASNVDQNPNSLFQQLVQPRDDAIVCERGVAAPASGPQKIHQVLRTSDHGSGKLKTKVKELIRTTVKRSLETLTNIPSPHMPALSHQQSPGNPKPGAPNRSTNEEINLHGGELLHPLRRLHGMEGIAEEEEESESMLAATCSAGAPQAKSSTWGAGIRRLQSSIPHLPTESEAISVMDQYMSGYRSGMKSEFKEDDGRIHRRSTLYVPYLHAVFAITLCVLDLILAVEVHLAVGEEDHLCQYTTVDGTQGYYLNQKNITILWALVCMYSMDWLYRTAFALGGTLDSAVTVLSSPRSWRLHEDPNMIWEFLVFITSIVLLVVTSNFCAYRDANDDAYSMLSKAAGIVHFVRVVNGIRRLAGLRDQMQKQLRVIVSQNKRRFVCKDHNLDLDLTYICDRLIAMSLPCVHGVVYRNGISDVAKFFRARHYGQFKVYNLCEDFESKGNGNYDVALLYNQVQKIPFYDHNAPPLQALINYCEDATAFLNERSENVVAVHCQGGKGRTGTFCSSLLLWTGCCTSAASALALFASRRTDSRLGDDPIQGVAAPSQIRYVKYVEDIVTEGHEFVPKRRILLKKIHLSDIPASWQSIDVSFVIQSEGVVKYDHGKVRGLMTPPASLKPGSAWEIAIGEDGIDVARDVSIRFFGFSSSRNDPEGAGKLGGFERPGTLQQGARELHYNKVIGNQLLFVQFHTSWVTGDLIFKKNEIDVLYHAKDKAVSPDFTMQVGYETEIAQILAKEHDNNALFVNSPSLLMMWLPARVLEVMTELQPKISRYYKGDLIAKSASRRRVLRLIKSGSVKRYRKGYDETKSIINNGTSRHGVCYGRGDFIGLCDFVGGVGMENDESYLKAWTETVEVWELMMDVSPSDLISGLLFKGATPEQSALIWQWAANQLRSVRKKLSHQFQLVHTMDRSKCDASISTTNQDSLRSMRLLRARLSLSTEEQILDREKAEIMTEDSGETKKTEGNMIVMANLVVFDTKGDNDLVVSFEQVLSVASSSRTLTLVVDTIDPSLSPRNRSRRVSFDGNQSVTSSGGLSPLHRIRTPNSERSATVVNRLRTRDGSPPKHGKMPSVGVASKLESSVDGDIDEKMVFQFKSSYRCREFATLLEKMISEKREHMRAPNRNALFTPGGQIRDGNTKFTYIMPNDTIHPEEGDFMKLLEASAQRQLFNPGDLIQSHGCTERKIFHILKGEVHGIGEDGDIDSTFEAGEFFGERSFLDSSNIGARCNFLAYSHVECQVLQAGTLNLLCRQPYFAARFYRAMAVMNTIRYTTSLSRLEVRNQRNLSSLKTSRHNSLSGVV